MPKVIILGSSNAIPDQEHENSHMAVVDQDRILLIDCVSNPLVRLKAAGLDVDKLDDIILTHFHPDHVSGVPLLLMDLWLLGRKRLLNLYGLEYTLSRLETMMELYGWSKWPEFYPVRFQSLPEEEMAHVLECDAWRVYSSPVMHIIPNIGLRIEFVKSGKILAYSSDTEPTPRVVRLAQQAELLIHEAAGEARGHSSARQAGEIATEAGAHQLALIHYGTGEYWDDKLVASARELFDGPVTLAEDFKQFEF